MKWIMGLFLLPGLIIGLTVHEAMHAFVARLLGDRNPQRMGRISLNPFQHLSGMGTLALFFLGFGWGKPVEINLYNFRRPKLYYLLTALAGPASNIALAALCLGLMHAGWLARPIVLWFPIWPGIGLAILYGVALSCYLVNGMLAVMNLLPIPPLDGSKIWPCIIPRMRPTLSGRWAAMSTVLLVIALMTGMVDRVVQPTMEWMQALVPWGGTVSRPRDFPAVMQTPPDATAQMYWREPSDAKDPNSWTLVCVASETYPAENTLAFYDRTLGEYGWQRLTHDLHEPDKPAAHTWERSGGDESDPNVMPGYWTRKTRWLNQEGELIVLTCAIYRTEAPVVGQAVDMQILLKLFRRSRFVARAVAEYLRVHPVSGIPDPNSPTITSESAPP